MMTQLSISEIKKILPHRYPMLLIDKVVQLEPGKSAEAIHNVSANEIFVHANERDTFPLPLTVEALAQTGAVALLSEEKFAGKTAYFGGIQKTEFFGEAQPGDELHLTTELTKIKGPIGLGIGEAKAGEKVIAKVELTFMIG